MRNTLRHVHHSARSPNFASKALFNRRAYSKRAPTPELSKLPAIAQNAPRHLSLRRTEPASAGHLIFRTPTSSGPLDPNHPLARIPPHKAYWKCPSGQSGLFTAKIIPHGILAHTAREKLPPFPSTEQTVSNSTANGDSKTFYSNSRYRVPQDRSEVIYASFMIITSKTAVHNDSVIRRKTSRRVREALRMIIIRGAKASEDEKSLVFDDGDIGEDRWLVKGWSYVLFPKLDAYRAPWPELVTALRDILEQLKTGAGRSPKQGSSHSSKQTPQSPVEPSSQEPSNSQQEPSATDESTNYVNTATPPPSKPKKPPIKVASTRAYSTDARSHQSRAHTGLPSALSRERHHARADIVLGTHDPLWHVASQFFPPSEHDPNIPAEDFLPLSKRNFFGSRPVFDIDGWEKCVIEEGSDTGQISLLECDADDAEGWTIAALESRQAQQAHSLDYTDEDVWEDDEPEDDLYIDQLLDSSNLPRFLQPHLPHHAGRQYGLKLKREWSPQNSLPRRHPTDVNYNDFVTRKFQEAAEIRRKARKKIRERWNVVDPDWLEELKQREIKRLEMQYDVTIAEGKGGKLRAVPNQSDSDYPDAPWWAPRRGSLGWVDPADRPMRNDRYTTGREEDSSKRYPSGSSQED